MTKRKIFFRADAGAQIGYGHFIRTLALADMLRDDFDCTFYTQSPSTYQQREADKVCPLVSLPSDDSKFERFLEYLIGDEIVVLDNYFYTSDYQKQIKDKGCKLVHIDDIHDRHFYADLIINHGNATQSIYDAESTTRFCLGPSYALLRKPFLTPSSNIERLRGKWVICFGGVDPQNLTEEAVKALNVREDVNQITAIVGEVYPHKAVLTQYDRVTILSSLTAEEMAVQYSSAEYVLCSASSVSYEALACGCSVFAGYYIDNQVDFYHGLCNNNLITPLGDLMKADFKTCLSNANVSIDKMNIHNASRNLLDAFKALDLRIVNYTDMTLDESRKIWEVRNLPAIRKYMTQPEPFPFESHQSFVESLRNDTSKLYYAIFRDDELVGSYDFIGIKDGDSAEHGLYINPVVYGKRYGTIIESVMDEYIRERGVHRILAEVLKNNLPSYHYHLKVGYRVYQEDEKYYYLERYI